MFFYYFYLLLHQNFVESLKLFLCDETFSFIPLSNREYSIRFIVAAFSVNSFPVETYFPVKNSYLLTFLDDKAEILAISFSKSN